MDLFESRELIKESTSRSLTVIVSRAGTDPGSEFGNVCVVESSNWRNSH